MRQSVREKRAQWVALLDTTFTANNKFIKEKLAVLWTTGIGESGNATQLIGNGIPHFSAFHRIECIAKFNLQTNRGERERWYFFSNESLVDCITASAPPFTPTANCRLWKKPFASEFVPFAKNLANSLLKTCPTAIGRSPLFFLNNVYSLALQSACETITGSCPRQLMFTS